MSFDCEDLKVKFEKIVADSVRRSIRAQEIDYLNLSINLESLAKRAMECVPTIIGQYYIHFFRTADREFGKMLMEYTLQETCANIAYQLVDRRVRDFLRGPYSEFGKKNSGEKGYLRKLI